MACLYLKYVLKTLAKSALLPLGFTAAASATSATVQKKMFGSGRPSDLASHARLNISNEEMSVIMKIIITKKACFQHDTTHRNFKD